MEIKENRIVIVKYRFFFKVILIAVILPINSCISYQKLIGQIYVDPKTTPCTAMDCNCCNQCNGTARIIAGLDTFELINKSGLKYNCYGNECDLENRKMECETFVDGKKYKLKGKIITKKYENDKVVFEVHSYEFINEK